MWKPWRVVSHNQCIAEHTHCIGPIRFKLEVQSLLARLDNRSNKFRGEPCLDGEIRLVGAGGGRSSEWCAMQGDGAVGSKRHGGGINTFVNNERGTCSERCGRNSQLNQRTLRQVMWQANLVLGISSDESAGIQHSYDLEARRVQHGLRLT